MKLKITLLSALIGTAAIVFAQNNRAKSNR
jgi:hypothetical protein